MKVVSLKYIQEATAITHGGVFHADEVLATAMLELAFGDVTVCRVMSVPTNAPANAIVYDIGGGEYDHHQRGGNGARENGVPYASAGLIWREFGTQILGKSYTEKKVWELVDRDLVQGVDAVDNGFTVALDIIVRQMTFSQMVGMLNPAADSDAAYFDEAFVCAVDFALSVLNCVIDESRYKLRMRRSVERAIKRSRNHIMVLHKHIPWKEALLISDNPLADEVFFVVYPSQRGGYNWQCVPKRLDGYDQRMSVPEAWRGLSGVDLQEETGVSDATFCHATGFMGAADSFSGAMAMAKLASGVS